jgi:outer membrane protein W
MSLYAQQFHIGADVNAGSSKKTDFGLGLDVFAAYSLNPDFEIRGLGGFYSADFSSSTEYLYDNSYTLSYAELSAIYYPLDYKIARIYVGAGPGYYFPRSSASSHGATEHTYSVKKDFDNKFGFHLLAGIKFTPDKLVSINVEVKYLILDSKFTAIKYVVNPPEIPVSTNLNMFSFRAGIIFNL